MSRAALWLAVLALAALGSCAEPERRAALAPAPPPATAEPPPRPYDFALTGAIQQGGVVRGQAPAGTARLTLGLREVALAPDGRFVIGFGRDQGSHAELTATLASGERLRASLRVAPRSWQIERLPSLRTRVEASPAYDALRARELERIRAARAVVSAGSGWQERFVWPATGRVSGVFGSQRIHGTVPRAPHSGVDIARPSGWPVVAPAGGIVTLASPPAFSLEGNIVFVDHGHGLTSAFLHLSQVDVTAGQRVVQGQRLGAVGATGRVTGAHLHWSLTWHEVRVDPQTLVPPMPAAVGGGEVSAD